MSFIDGTLNNMVNADWQDNATYSVKLPCLVLAIAENANMEGHVTNHLLTIPYYDGWQDDSHFVFWLILRNSDFVGLSETVLVGLLNEIGHVVQHLYSKLWPNQGSERLLLTLAYKLIYFNMTTQMTLDMTESELG